MSLEIGFVGVSSAWPGRGEETACYLVNGCLLVDTGWNAAIGLKAFGGQPADLDAVFITHCHQDHTLGLPGVLFANRNRAGVRPDAAPLVLYGPRDLPAVRDGALALLQAERYPDCVPAHEVVEVFPGDQLEVGGLALRVGRAFHPLDARCLRIEDPESGASVVFSGDTAYHEGLASLAQDCDVLVHEAAGSPASTVAGLQRYLHSRPQDAARVAKEAHASVLALVHYRSEDGAATLAAARETFPNTCLAKRGQRLKVLGPGQAAWV